MAHKLETIQKRSTFLKIKEKGKFYKSDSFNLIILEDISLNKATFFGFTATKKLGSAIIRNEAKRIMRELARKIILECCKKNYYYVLIAKSSILKKKHSSLEIEIKKLISKC